MTEPSSQGTGALGKMRLLKIEKTPYRQSKEGKQRVRNSRWNTKVRKRGRGPPRHQSRYLHCSLQRTGVLDYAGAKRYFPKDCSAWTAHDGAREMPKQEVVVEEEVVAGRSSYGLIATPIPNPPAPLRGGGRDFLWVCFPCDSNL